MYLKQYVVYQNSMKEGLLPGNNYGEKGLRIFSPYRADDASSSHNLNFVTAKCTDIN